MRIRKNKEMKFAEQELRDKTRYDFEQKYIVEGIIKNNNKAIDLNISSLLFGVLSAWFTTEVILAALGIMQLKNPDQVPTYCAAIGCIAVYDAILARSKRMRAREFERIAQDDLEEVSAFIMEKEKKG